MLRFNVNGNREMIESTSRPTPPIRRPSGWLLAPRVNGGLLQTAAKRQFLNSNTAAIVSAMPLILNSIKYTHSGKNTFHTFGISPRSDVEHEEFEGRVPRLKSFLEPEIPRRLGAGRPSPKDLILNGRESLNRNKSAFLSLRFPSLAQRDHGIGA